MKHLISIALSLIVAACASTPTSTTPGKPTFNLQQAAQTATGLVTLASAVYTQYNQDKAGKADPAAVTGQVNSDLNGVAALLQGYVGSGQTPAQVNAAQGAANPVAASTVVAALPNVPVTQQVVDTVYAAAAKAK